MAERLSAAPMCSCGHTAAQHEQGTGCLAGWTWDAKGVATTEGCTCEWAHLTSPSFSRWLRARAEQAGGDTCTR